MTAPAFKMTPPRIESLQLGKPKTVEAAESGEWWDKEWTSGIFKEPVSGPVWLAHLGLDGDGVADLRVHGGVDKAVCSYPSEHYALWREEAGGLSFPFGAFGENFTTSGLLEDEVCVGDVYEIGEAVVQVTQPREPCWKPSRRWRIKDLAARILETGRTGFYFRTLRHGHVECSEAFRLTERPCPEWTVTRCNRIMHHDKDDLAGPGHSPNAPRSPATGRTASSAAAATKLNPRNAHSDGRTFYQT